MSLPNERLPGLATVDGTAKGPDNDRPEIDHKSSRTNTVQADNHASIDKDSLATLVTASSEASSPATLCPSAESPCQATATLSTDTEKGPYVTTHPLEQHRINWRPSFLRIAPLVGLGALLFAVLSTVASFAILKASDGDAVADWKYQPTVYLAILTALSNKALSFAVVQGTVVTWWLKALAGTTLKDMHEDWGVGQFLFRAMVSGRRFNALALACLCGTLVAMDGPLLQRASSVTSSTPQQPIPLNVSITPTVPAYFTGWSEYSLYPLLSTDFTKDFLPIVREYIDQSPIIGVTGCSGTCTGTVRAPALAVTECYTTLSYINYAEPLPKQEQAAYDDIQAVPTNRTVFFVVPISVNNTIANDVSENLILGTRISDNAVAETCAGNLNTTSCYLRSAVAEYPITVTDGTVTFAEPPSNPKIIALAENAAITDRTIAEYDLHYPPVPSYVRTTLSGMAHIAQWSFATWGALVPSPVEGDTPVLAWKQSSPLAFGHLTNYVDWDYQNACAPAWSDPRDDAMAILNEMMFRKSRAAGGQYSDFLDLGLTTCASRNPGTGVYTAQHYDESWLKSRIDDGWDIHYDITGTPVSEINVFQSNFTYFVGAAVVEILCILAILYTFWGFWNLGHSTSFSPVEIAKAFDAPILKSAPSNVNARRMANFEGDRNVQYGLTTDELTSGEHAGLLGTEKLAVADVARVRTVTGRRRSVAEYYDLLKAFLMERRRLMRERREARKA
ncbi:uncharacterized protein LTR77_001143 [Saxophila tyrrhenica]|uniref:Uncharacterized protein n=1 Tax=Saxophila tyrrhenica TaxID=1690608 RepID=A0AAV9PJA8_9PEZI|nr:hypothetical protein LTR77_001143 [Saxophila tyrrhenica]